MNTYIVNGKSDQSFILRKTKTAISTAGYPMRFVNSVINDFESKEHDLVITSFLFNDF